MHKHAVQNHILDCDGIQAMLKNNLIPRPSTYSDLWWSAKHIVHKVSLNFDGAETSYIDNQLRETIKNLMDKEAFVQTNLRKALFIDEPILEE
mgnify:FL=1